MKKRNIAKETFQQQERAYRKKLNFHNRKFIHAFINLKSHYQGVFSKPYKSLDIDSISVLKNVARKQYLFEYAAKSYFLNKFKEKCDQPRNYRPEHGEEYYNREFKDGFPF